MTFFSHFDLFKLPVKFYFSEKAQLHSKTGILFSFFIYAIMIYSFFNSDFLLKEQPFVLSESIQTTHADKIRLLRDALLRPFVLHFLGTVFL